MRIYLLFTIFLIIIGAILRFYNLNWDQGNYFHPDERNIAAAVSRIHFFEQLNPGFFAYGGFLSYLYRATGDLLVLLTKDDAWVYDWGYINIIGRFYSALFSTLTIPIIFLLAQKVFNKNIAFLSAIFSAFTVSFIQMAHFSVTESFLVLVITLVCLYSIELYRKVNFTSCFKLGTVIGIGAATKITALSFFIFPLCTYLLVFLKYRTKFFKRMLLLLVLILSSIVTFTFFSPYTFLSWNKFIESMRYESGVVLGSLPVPYTLQFDKTIPYLFQIKNLFWQMGPVALSAIIGFILLPLHFVKTRDPKLLVFIPFPLVYFLYVGAWHTKFLRFMLPMLPFLVITASWLLFEIKQRARMLGNILITVSCLVTILWALSFFSIYTREQTRITASKWIYQNIPANSKILTEHWDDGLPIPSPLKYPTTYAIEALTIYEPDNAQKIDYYAQKLSSTDYIVINSRRLYGTLINLEDKYPITSKYYRLLFEHKFGYEKIAEFTSYPSIFGFEINDDGSEETFQVYDHPKVIVFKNVQKLQGKEIKKLLQ